MDDKNLYFCHWKCRLDTVYDAFYAHYLRVCLTHSVVRTIQRRTRSLSRSFPFLLRVVVLSLYEHLFFALNKTSTSSDQSLSSTHNNREVSLTGSYTPEGVG